MIGKNCSSNIIFFRNEFSPIVKFVVLSYVLNEGHYFLHQLRYKLLKLFYLFLFVAVYLVFGSHYTKVLAKVFARLHYWLLFLPRFVFLQIFRVYRIQRFEILWFHQIYFSPNVGHQKSINYNLL